MEYKLSSDKPPRLTPRIIIHGGAGNITRENLPSKSYKAYRDALLGILDKAHSQLASPQSTALDVATYAVSLLEENPLFNAGRGAVYTTAGTHELEASVMVSRGYRKRGCGVMKVRHARSPIKLAREMLVRGESADGGGAQGHCQLEGDTIDRLNVEWGLETVKPSWYWTKKRWEEHRRGLGLSHDDETYEKAKRKADGGKEEIESISSSVEQEGREYHAGDTHWDGKEYLPQGTVGAVVMDSLGVICVATSTGGLTNKLPGRIGDTPTLGAGFWAEEWLQMTAASVPEEPAWLAECLPALSGYGMLGAGRRSDTLKPSVRAAAMSGTGNGDSFLRISAVRTAAAIARFSTGSFSSLQQGVTTIAGPNGLLQQSAGDRWLTSGEGEGGIIGIELRESRGHVVFDYNRGMLHAWIDDNGKPRFEAFQDERSI